MTRALLQVDVFGESPFLGNPLAVVLDADGIGDAMAALDSLRPMSSARVRP